MTKKFTERFQIPVSNEEARKRFVNRAHNEIYTGIAFERVPSSLHFTLGRIVATHLGDRLEHHYLGNFVGNEFERNLQAIEGVHVALGAMQLVSIQKGLTGTVERLLQNAETDLGVRWENGLFYPSGAKLLDDRLVNDSLHWVRDKGYENVSAPLEKALRHLLDVKKRPDLGEDVITDAYEALEALAGIVTGRPQSDLSANRELFIKNVKASDAYKKLLREYIEYANVIRHAKEQSQPRPKVSLAEAESFLYLTGIFIRLATVRE
jgi:hypothetical protein